MMEMGFYHPARGYWQTMSAPTEEILAAYPEGTVEVPLKPGAGFSWSGEAWVPEPPDPEALALEARARRDALLTACDWTQVPDAPVDRAAWAAYRQALRDVPEQPGFPAGIAWPEPPAA
ncbi:tail fiber assembly protein [Cereibacter johrii]|uniref:tail fiber assembly protein n=1 Tax=Cereibacter johrii TaxID=445629 RepID=UPI002B20103E|nr:tail fiber assembly protein [Cereibacter johrii]MEA5163562.1 tail fiber assembly protein [Cereibacter johrii]